ncbi:MAG: hypothetical protein PHR06_14250 [Candidatus Cloacimonetes bacterium]|nr:hypothetical protein [Candidatus Cloacimonadota bacterium]
MENFMASLGIWLGAFFTLAIFSFLWKDNPVYKFAEQMFVGLSAGYWFIYTFYNILLPNLIFPLAQNFSANWIKLFPAILGIMILMRLFRGLEWMSRFPIALLVGTTAGISMLRYLKSDVINQMTATMINPFASGNITSTIGEILLIIGTITGLIYFYFSKKHEGALGLGAKVGIYFLMISFGAAFGYTAMARISLLIGRLQFLFGQWLGIISY